MEYAGGFRYDDVCMLVGLEKTPDLNGRAVRVCLPTGPMSAPERVPCELLLGAKKLAVRSKNLFKIESEDALEDERVRELMPHDDRIDAGMLLQAKRNSVVVAPGVIMSNLSDSPHMRRPKPTRPDPSSEAPLTDEEKAEALRIGQWGDRTSPFEWGAFVRAVKAARGGEGCYPCDWHPAIIQGGLFFLNGQPTRSGFAGA